ncbi:MAG TPA: CoA pyrophosphatase [Acidimicrobiales bacterium]|nr:CoA pyrophosphatase [Acidimicrobiales bacterium]
MSYRQAIPRPEGAERVEPEAAFARLGAGEADQLTAVEVVERAFGGRVEPDGLGSGRIAAAVLIPLLRGEGGGLDVVVIRRGVHLRSNPGEIAFPGGRIERGETPAAAALRETHEEVGLAPSAVRLLGALPPVARASRPEPIAAFVGLVEGRPRLSANPMEVDAVMTVPLAELADPSRYWEERWVRDGIEWRMPFFELGDDVLWGASARMLVMLFERLTASR